MLLRKARLLIPQNKNNFVGARKYVDHPPTLNDYKNDNNKFHYKKVKFRIIHDREKDEEIRSRNVKFQT